MDSDNAERSIPEPLAGKRLFEGSAEATFYQKFRPDFKNTGIGEKIFNYTSQTLKLETPFKCAIDVGCGSGQLTQYLAPYFQKVMGVDVSEAQIKMARTVNKSENIEYIVGQAEDLSFIPDKSVELVTTATSIVYFKLDRFFREVDRILKPGGCFAVIFPEASYQQWIQLLDVSGVEEHKLKDVSRRCSALVNEIFNERPVEGVALHFYQSVLESTKELPMPSHYEDICKLLLETQREDNICILDGYFRSSAMILERVDHYKKKGIDIFEYYSKRFLEILREVSNSPETVPIKFIYPFKCTFCRKPKLV